MEINADHKFCDVRPVQQSKTKRLSIHEDNKQREQQMFSFKKTTNNKCLFAFLLDKLLK